jgi:iron complex transport system substrate-binding protein
MKFYSYLLILFISPLQAEITVTDDMGNNFSFKKPLKRIISLAPHITELLFSAGARDQIIATVSYSDYPEAAKKIPRIGSYKKIDLEKIIELRPELVIAWSSGGSLEQIKEMQRIGLKIFFSEPRKFSDIAKNIKTLGKLLGTESKANNVSNNFLQELNTLQQQYKNRSSVSVFYQVWQSPLVTINKDHLITQVIEFCGGTNVFGNLSARAPRIAIESILSINPDVIIIGINDQRIDWADNWKKWPSLKAVKNQRVFTINADLIVRQTPRILQGTRLMCEYIDSVRNNNR